MRYKIMFIKSLLLMVSCLLAINFIALEARADIPQRINIQGVLTPRPDENIEIKFQLYNLSSGGNKVGPESKVDVVHDKTTVPNKLYVDEQGFFNKSLPVPGISFDIPYFLEIVVDNIALEPRQPLHPVPYAITAKNVYGGTVDCSGDPAIRGTSKKDPATWGMLGYDPIVIQGQIPVVQINAKNYYGAFGRSGSDNYGVLGYRRMLNNQFVDEAGVYGSSTSHYGVYGSSASGYGVYGQSTSGYGGYFKSSDPGLNKGALEVEVTDANSFGEGARIFSKKGSAIYAKSEGTAATIYAKSEGGGPALYAYGDGSAYSVNAFAENGRAVRGHVMPGFNGYSGYFTGGQGLYADKRLGGAIDLAENIETNDSKLEAGDVVVIDPGNANKIKLSDKPYGTSVAGIVSTKPDYIMGADIKGGKPISLAGRVPCKVSDENGPIEIGDLLTSSSTPGYAMKVTDKMKAMGAVLGKAMEPLPSGKGKIMVLVTLQ